MKRERIAVFAALTVFLAALVFVSHAAGADAPRMTKDELKAMLGSPEVIVIDARAVTDWLLTRQKIKGAVRQNPREFDEWVGRYPKDKTIVLYCA